MRSRRLGLLLFGIVFTDCRAVPPSTPTISTTQTSAPSPVVEIESLDPSIPLGDSFPIVVNLTGAPANQQVEFEIVNGDIIPSTLRVVTQTDGDGKATVRLTGRSTKAELNALYARAYIAGGKANVGSLYVNFEPPQTVSLRTQADAAPVGEPITLEQYAETLPTASSTDDLKTASANSASGVRLQGVRFPEADGRLGKPLDALEFSSGAQLADAPVASSGTCALTSTHVYLKTMADGAVANFPTGTKVFISGPGTTPDKTTYTDKNGKVSFSFGCDSALYLRVQGLSNTGLQLVTGNDDRGYPLLIWSKTVSAGPGKVLTAGGLAGDTVQLSTAAANSTSRTAQQVYTIVERFRQWDLSSHRLYTSATFPIATVYPDYDFTARSRAHYGRIFIDAGVATRTIVHETGHEVYYRRMLGQDSYLRFYNDAVRHNTFNYPFCSGYFLGTGVWTREEGCVAMLEGFALWFEMAAQSGLYNNRDFTWEDRPANPPNGRSIVGNVAAFLWDVGDEATRLSIRDTDNDEVKVPGSPKARYKEAAHRFQGQNPNTDFMTIWFDSWYTTLPEDQRFEYCKILQRNAIIYRGYNWAFCRDQGVVP